jgi:hypothetical protein
LDFKGIEFASLDTVDLKNMNLFYKLKFKFANFLLGNRLGFTIVGPASYVKEVKKDPKKMRLLMSENEK